MNGDSYSVIRAIRGPITLITLGALFALNNFTPYRFEQTWPVLLIVFGLLSLMKRSAQPPAPPAPPPPPRPYQATGYSQSPYSQPPAGSTTSTAGPSKGGFGASAPPRSGDAAQSTPSTPEGGSV
jgi:hypothetical protein